MHKWFSTETRTPRMSSVARAGLRMAALGAFLLAGLVPMSANAAPAGCAALQAKYPSLKGKQLVNAINPHTPGDRKSTRLNSSHLARSRMPSSA